MARCIGFCRNDQADTRDDHGDCYDHAPGYGFAEEQPAKGHSHDRIDV